jgi:hypothetical protein
MCHSLSSSVVLTAVKREQTQTRKRRRRGRRKGFSAKAMNEVDAGRDRAGGTKKMVEQL